MAAQKAMFTGFEAIMSGYDAMSKTPYYSLWYNSRDIAFSFNEDDEAKGRQQLVETLQAAEQNGVNDIMFIKFHPEKDKKYITSKTPVVGAMAIRVVPLSAVDNSVTYQQIAPASQSISGTESMVRAAIALENLPQTIATQIGSVMKPIEDRLAALEGDDHAEPDTFDKIAALLEKPGMVQLIGSIFTGLGSKVSGLTQPPPPQQPQRMSYQVAGIPPEQGSTVQDQDLAAENGDVYIVDNDKVTSALERLNKVCFLDTDLSLLADLSEKNPALFNLVLQQLRAQ